MTKKNRSSINRSTRGFTLLEVLIAVLIVGITATAVLPMLSDYTSQAREAQEEANLQAKAQAIDRYITEHNAPAGYVYDAATEEFIAYYPIDAEGVSRQMLNPTDANGNVLGDEVTSEPGPFQYGPYLARIPSEPASFLLGVGPPKEIEDRDRRIRNEDKGRGFLSGFPLTWLNVQAPNGVVLGVFVNIAELLRDGKRPKVLSDFEPYIKTKATVPLDPTAVNRIVHGVGRLADVSAILTSLDEAHEQIKRSMIAAGQAEREDDKFFPELNNLKLKVNVIENNRKDVQFILEALDKSEKTKGFLEYLPRVTALIQREKEHKKAIDELRAGLTAEEIDVFDKVYPARLLWTHVQRVRAEAVDTMADGIDFPVTPYSMLDGSRVFPDEPYRGKAAFIADLARIEFEADVALIERLKESSPLLLKLGLVDGNDGTLTTADSIKEPQYRQALERFYRKLTTRPAYGVLESTERLFEDEWTKADMTIGLATRRPDQVVKPQEAGLVTLPDLDYARLSESRILDREIENAGAVWQRAQGLLREAQAREYGLDSGIDHEQQLRSLARTRHERFVSSHAKYLGGRDKTGEENGRLAYIIVPEKVAHYGRMTRPVGGAVGCERFGGTAMLNQAFSPKIRLPKDTLLDIEETLKFAVSLATCSAQ